MTRRAGAKGLAHEVFGHGFFTALDGVGARRDADPRRLSGRFRQSRRRADPGADRETEDRRRDLAKAVKQMAEESRIRVRSARRDGIENTRKLGKDGGLAEDEVERMEKEVQKLTDSFVKKIDDATTAKEADIMKV